MDCLCSRIRCAGIHCSQCLRRRALIVSAVNLTHSGSFNMSTDGAEKWLPLVSIQRVVVRRPGFVWDARIQMLPGLDVRVHDAYVAGNVVKR